MTNRQPEPTGSEYELVDRLIEENLFRELAEFVAVPTHRGGGMTEAEVVANLEKLRDSLLRQTRDFNQGQTNHQLTPFEWKQPIPGEERAYWLFGLRLGNGPYKIAVSSHLDTVPPGEIPDWEPFRLKREYRDYLGLPDQEFYVGRGSIDDKGPAIVAFNVLKAIAKEYDGSALLDEITLELLFDTSEETDMAMPHYLRAKKEDTNPDFGLI